MTDRARSTQETGDRILDATIALFTELPYAQLTLRAVAERADVTVQTVIRRFGDKEGLTAAAAARSREHISAQRSAAPVGDLAGAVDNLVTHYEEAGDLALRLLAEEQSAPQLAELAEMGRTLHREWCARVFAPTLARLRGADRNRRAAQLVAICDVYTWKLLRRDQGLSRDETVASILKIVEALIEPRSG
jgi:AcrR family transcriptional regulator